MADIRNTQLCLLTSDYIHTIQYIGFQLKILGFILVSTTTIFILSYTFTSYYNMF